MADINKLAEDIYKMSLGRRWQGEFKDLPLYEQELWRQSARQSIRASKILGKLKES